MAGDFSCPLACIETLRDALYKGIAIAKETKGYEVKSEGFRRDKIAATGNSKHMRRVIFGRFCFTLGFLWKKTEVVIQKLQGFLLWECGWNQM